jgi:hypothetical protein
VTQIIGNMSLLELIWHLVTLGGLVITSANLMDASDDRRFASRSRYNATIKQIVAAEHLRFEITYLLVHTLFYGLGLLAAQTPPAPNYDTISTSRLIFVVGVLLPSAFYIVQIAMITNSIMSRRTRKRLILQRLTAEPTAPDHSEDSTT